MLAFIQVVQLAKAAGASKIIGVASKSKCQSVVDNGADVCLDYGAPSFEEDLIKATERKVDVFFDNVGGTILDLMLGRMGLHGRIAACGAIADYNSKTPKVRAKYIFNFMVKYNRRIQQRNGMGELYQWTQQPPRYNGHIAKNVPEQNPTPVVK